MTQYNSLNVKLSNSQLNKLKSAVKNETDVLLYVLIMSRKSSRLNPLSTGQFG